MFGASTEHDVNNTNTSITNMTRALLHDSGHFRSPPPNRSNMNQTEPLAIRDAIQFENPSDEMIRRWRQIIERSLPAIDLIDLAAEHNYFYSSKRQFAPEYSQSGYLAVMRNELAIGDYIDFEQGQMRVSDQARRHMITLLEDLNR